MLVTTVSTLPRVILNSPGLKDRDQNGTKTQIMHKSNSSLAHRNGISSHEKQSPAEEIRTWPVEETLHKVSSPSGAIPQ